MEDKILADDVQVLRASDVWSVTGNFNSPGVSTYLGSGIYGAFQSQNVQYHAAGKAPSGTTRYYNRKVTALNGDHARVIVCEDGRQAHDKIVSTGQAVPNSSDGLAAIVIDVVKDAGGVWQAQVLTKEKAPGLCPVS